VKRFLGTVLATLALLAPLAPAHAATGLEVDDPKGDVEIAAPKPAKLRTVARSVDLVEVTAVLSGGQAILTARMRDQVDGLDPGKGGNSLGVAWFVCTAGTEDACDGTVLSATVAKGTKGDVGWLGTDEDVPDCPATVKTKGRFVILKTTQECVRITDGVTVSAQLLARIGDPRTGGAILTDDTMASDSGSL
jgi:hypothetical protein